MRESGKRCIRNRFQLKNFIRKIHISDCYKGLPLAKDHKEGDDVSIIIFLACYRTHTEIRIKNMNQSIYVVIPHTIKVNQYRMNRRSEFYGRRF